MLTRRGIFGVLGGGAVAGPKLAAGIAEHAMRESSEHLLHRPSVTGMSAAIDGDWRVKRIAKLRALISGNGENEETRRRRIINRLQQTEMVERLRLDGLRSISPAHKARMLADGEAARHSRIRMADAEFELADLLNPMDW